MQVEGDRWLMIGDANADTDEFDIAFWQAQGPAAIFAAAWDMVVFAHRVRGRNPNELRLRRTPVVVKPIRR